MQFFQSYEVPMGKMIVLEGMDGAGTTTQAKLLEERLKAMGFSVLRTAEPTKSPWGQEIRKWLASPIEGEPFLLTMLALAFATDRMHHVYHTLAPALKDNDFVIVDRYVLSSLVYQGLHLPSTFIAEINRFALIPDICLVLDISANEAMARLEKRANVRDFYESRAMLEKIRGRYLHFAELDPEHIVQIDGSGSVEDVALLIQDVIKKLF
jgi:dTMP kinase